MPIRREKKEGKAEGRAEGKAEGKAEGRAEGKAEGKAEGRAEGKAEGKALSILELLEDLGPVPASLKEQILSQKDEAKLSRMLKLAARADRLEEFIEKMAG